jgi:hypothetical protein
MTADLDKRRISLIGDVPKRVINEHERHSALVDSYG